MLSYGERAELTEALRVAREALALAEALRVRVAELEAKRGPGRPRKEVG